MQVTNTVKKEQEFSLPQEALQVLEALTKMEEFVIELRKELLADIKLNGKSIHLQLKPIGA